MNDTTCGPHCGHWDDIQELDTLRKALQAVTDQRDTLLAVVRELRAEIGRMERGQ